MRARLSALLVTAVATAVLPAQPAPEIENVAAFARLYGVARYFYPSDAAAGLDWNRFAVHGVARVRPAASAAALRGTLEDLFAPLGPGLEIGPILPGPGAAGATGEPLVAWRYLGAGFGGSNAGGPYQGKRTHRATAAGIDGFVTVMQTLPAQALRGKAIRLRGQVRAVAADSGAAALWLRVDRPNQAMGFFDNMQDRPIREPRWHEYTIQGTVADDAAFLAIGAMASGAVTADFDAIDLAAKGPSGDWTPVPIKDPGFEAASDAGAAGWLRAGNSQTAVVSRPGEGARQGRQFLRFTPPPAGAADAELFADASPAPGAHVDVDLGSGLKARVPLALTDARARSDAARQGSLDALAAVASVPGPSETPGLDERLADVVVAWNVLRHFYPYWTEAGVDWDARLRPRLESARAAETRAAQRDALRALVADARDGHGFVGDALDKTEKGSLPVRLALLGDRLVITASAVPSDAPVGAAVSTIDGTPAAPRLAAATRLFSGTTQWREVRAASELAACPKGATVRLGIEAGAESREVALICRPTPPPAEKRPEPVTELEPGVWYVDLTRATMAQVTPVLDKLAAARGVVFDMRGYPGDAGAGILPHLLQAPESDRWMHVAKIVGPFGQSIGWQSFGWDVKPASPRIAGQAVFLTDGRAISYAESVMGYVGDRRLGTIVGGTTAGTNGNVATFTTPGGYTLGFTGMRVTGHDGSTPHHLVGVKPDIPAAPTLAGLRAGRDEVLERGLAVARGAAAMGEVAR
jgi:hypothetical protein